MPKKPQPRIPGTGVAQTPVSAPVRADFHVKDGRALRALLDEIAGDGLVVATKSGVAITLKAQ